MMTDVVSCLQEKGAKMPERESKTMQRRTKFDAGAFGKMPSQHSNKGQASRHGAALGDAWMHTT